MKFPIFLASVAAGCMLAAADFRGSELFDRNRIVPEGMGVNIHFFDHEPGMDALKSLDMRWLRMDITWDRVEREKGVYDFSQVDKLMPRPTPSATSTTSPASPRRSSRSAPA